LEQGTEGTWHSSVLPAAHPYECSSCERPARGAPPAVEGQGHREGEKRHPECHEGFYEQALAISLASMEQPCQHRVQGAYPEGTVRKGEALIVQHGSLQPERSNRCAENNRCIERAMQARRL